MRRPMGIPDCYDPVEQERRRDLSYTAMIMRRPCCECCGEHLTSETYLDLSAFGLNGVACERCIDKNTFATVDLDDDYG